MSRGLVRASFNISAYCAMRLNPAVPADPERFVNKLLEKDRARRPTPRNNAQPPEEAI